MEAEATNGAGLRVCTAPHHVGIAAGGTAGGAVGGTAGGAVGGAVGGAEGGAVGGGVVAEAAHHAHAALSPQHSDPAAPEEQHAPL